MAGESAGKVLNGWKAIAKHLGRGERTVMRWAKQRKLPAHRVPGEGRSAVFAYAYELDAWLAAAQINESDVETVAPASGVHVATTRSLRLSAKSW